MNVYVLLIVAYICIYSTYVLFNNKKKQAMSLKEDKEVHIREFRKREWKEEMM